jgi:hypothetical protein
MPPGPADFCNVFAVEGDRQFGDWAFRAAAWAGSGATYVDLNPAGFDFSAVLAASGDHQAGWAQVQTSTDEHAMIWSGTAASAVTLHPAGAISSVAYAMTQTHQGGQVVLPIAFGFRAALWSGTPESFVDLHPPDRGRSSVFGMFGDQQVGEASVLGGNTHAALWNGTVQSYRDMHPYPTGLSQMLATCGSAQVGYVNSSSIGAGIKAGIWFGTPESFLNLAQFLPPGAGSSVATCIEFRDGVYTVGGYARYSNIDQPFVWVGVPSPASAAAWAMAGIFAARRKR